MFIALLILIILVCIFLVLIVLVQNPKGELSSQFAGAGTQLMGVQKTSDLLEKITWGLAITLLVLSLATNALLPRGDQGNEPSSIIVDKAKEMPAVEMPKAGVPELPPTKQ